jgi:MFS family permease
VPSSLRTRARSARAGIDRAIAILGLLAFISQAGVSIMLPLLPLYAVQVGATPSQLGLMVGAFSVTATIGQLSAGVLASRISARRQMPLGQAIYAAGNFLIATAGSAIPLIAFRAMSGLGGGLTLISERLYIARVTASSRLAYVNGVVSAAGSSGSVLGPLLGAALATQNLQVPFIVVGCTATVAAVAALAFLPPESPEPESSNAIEGTASTPEPVASPVAPAGPDVSRSPWRTRAGPLARLAAWSVAFNAAYGAWITTFAPYATEALGFAASDVALFFAPFAGGAIVLGPILARVADRSGRRRMVAIGTLMVLVNLAFLVAAAPVPLIFASAVIAGGGLSAAQSSWFAMLGVATDGGRRGQSFGLVSALSNLGVIAGAALASIAWELIDLRAGIVTSGAFLVLATIALALVPRDRRPE